ncbi:hypothetical protein M8C21_027233, partial [Ambrosia artemisiifolia]
KTNNNLHVSLEAIKAGTQNFSDYTCVGEGRFWKLYEGEVTDANGCTAIFAKRWDIKSHQGRTQFFTELNTLLKYKHENLIRLIGYCNEKNEKIIIYEHACNGSLAKHLHDPSLTKVHERAEHVDDNACISLGYIDPQYKFDGYLSRFSDIYSLGVILFEMLCGRLAWAEGCKDHSQSLGPLVVRYYNEEGNLDNMIFDGIKEQITPPSLTTFLTIAIQCLHNWDKQPTLDRLITQLGKALKLQEDYEIWEPKLPIDYKEIIKRSKRPYIFKSKTKRDLYDMFSIGILLKTTNCFHSEITEKEMKWYQQKDFHTRTICYVNGDLFLNQASHGAIVEVIPSTLKALHFKKLAMQVKQGESEKSKEVQQVSKSKSETDKFLPMKMLSAEEIVHNSSDGKKGTYVIKQKTFDGDHLKDDHLLSRIKTNNNFHVSLEAINAGTQNFSDYTCVGEGRFWKLYEGEVTDANGCTAIFAKRWDSKSHQGRTHKVLERAEHVDDNCYISLGYIDPEYEFAGCLTESSDIYSLGVILFEMLCGRLAWAEGCEDHSQSLGPLAVRYYNEEGNLYNMIFDGIKEQITPPSLTTFQTIAIQCLEVDRYKRPTITQLITQLKKALEFQEDYEIWEPKLPIDYKEVIEVSKTPDIYDDKRKKDLYDMFLKGILLQDGKHLVSMGCNGERNLMVSAKMFFYKIPLLRKWRSIPESRFPKVAEMFDISDMKIRIKIRNHFFATCVNYKVHLIFRFRSPSKSKAERMYVNLKYRMGNESLCAYFATLREDGWMMIELFQSLNHNNNTDFEKASHGAIVEVILSTLKAFKFKKLTMQVKHGESEKSKEVQQVSKSKSETDKFLPMKMLSGEEVVHNSSDVAIQHRYDMDYELPRKHVFHIEFRISSKMLSAHTENVCYLVFKL